MNRGRDGSRGLKHMASSANKILVMDRKRNHHSSERTVSRSSAVEGNTVRKLAAYPVQEEKHTVSETTSRNRARALQMNLSYVIFLAAAAALCVAICVNYLKLQASYTQLQKRSTSLETQLNSLRLENDRQYEGIMASVNLEEVRMRAIDILGMSYSVADQVVLYDADNGDFVKQYQDVPEE